MKKPIDSFYYSAHSAITYLKDCPDYMGRSMWELRGGIGAGIKYCDLRGIPMSGLTTIENRVNEILSQIAFHRDIMPIIRSDVRMGIARFFFEIGMITGFEPEDSTFEDKCNSAMLEHRCLLVLEAVKKRKEELMDPYR